MSLGRYTVPLLVLVFAFSAALGADEGIATCIEPVLNISEAQERAGNYTPLQARFGESVFWARAGAGPLGFLTFVTSVCVYFGVTAGMERGFLAALPLPRVTGSPIAAHSILACMLLVFVVIHVAGHMAAKFSYDAMTPHERNILGHPVSE